MAKGYWIARVDVENDAEYATYRSLNGIAFAKYGAKFLVRGGAREVVKGTPRKHDVVINVQGDLPTIWSLAIDPVDPREPDRPASIALGTAASGGNG